MVPELSDNNVSAYVRPKPGSNKRAYTAVMPVSSVIVAVMYRLVSVPDNVVLSNPTETTVGTIMKNTDLWYYCILNHFIT